VTFVGLPVGLLVAWLAYREAARHEQQYGKSPWNISPKMWAVIVFFTGLLIGGVLLYVAGRADKKNVRPVPSGAGGVTGGPAPAGPAVVRPAAGPVPTPSGRGRMGSVL